VLITDTPASIPAPVPAPTAGAPVIELRNVTLWRRTQEEFHYDLKRLLFALIERRYRAPQKRRVLHGITVDIRRGEKIGIIGANGSGKSTLLKLIAGILKPTSGSVSVHGAIAPLIELGAGFDPDLSVVDNIVYYGVLLGRTHGEMSSRIEAILNFAELEDHANAPLKTLSSGMAARLGFAIATDVRPEILILDEVLAVGDEAFRRKSSERIARFWDAHSTIIVVSHDPKIIEGQCERAILLDGGRMVAIGSASEVMRQYEARLAENRAVIDREMIERLNDRVVRGEGGSAEEQRIYLIRDGKKHLIPHPGWLEQAGLRWPDDVVFLDIASIRGIPVGPAVEWSPSSWVDSPADGEWVDAESFTMDGWAISAEGRAWTSVVVRAGGVEIGRTESGSARPDVAAILKLEDANVGFAVPCRIPADMRSSASIEVSCEVEFADGRRRVVDRRTVRV
jgi:ABC-type polysaccharide/polyol phosphate transport system ATPase subunit